MEVERQRFRNLNPWIFSSHRRPFSETQSRTREELLICVWGGGSGPDLVSRSREG